ncbi:hypothetical protein DVK00_20215 [Haloarcula sp. Atlit-47R]|uniref:three-Cys-motif partner protein TcmP n=1 Tax=Haloarcula sp. Atlit-47R TaxID=2282132 RepID=UPI000EF20295|nr:three-Cys-motif partner protein TcmP [Haloarcula sp. Atlit-47R]RLM41314.1 hypothetical protein DVK00_20215 [Haloarcula sp. Atlit-47R]
MRDDNDPEKQRMKGQTEIKHTILQKYLRPWLYKITEVDDHIRYIDGFAGWGRYDDGSPGSPLLAMEVVSENLNDGVGRLNSKLDTFNCTFIEKTHENYKSLSRAVATEEKNTPSQIVTDTQNREFTEFAYDFIAKHQDGVSPSFIFVDPFGFSGVPFSVVDDLINLRPKGIELFITFMSGKMARFKDSETHQVAIDEIMGTDSWRQEVDAESRDERAEQFMRLYEQQLRSVADVEFVWPFEMKKEESRQTNYYLVHATNHYDGFKLMKDTMFRAGAEDQFAYLGPDHYRYADSQTGLSDFDERDESNKRIQKLADFLHDVFADDKLRFGDVMRLTYEQTTLIEKHYRRACKTLVEQDRARIINRPALAEGTETGLNNDDRVRFIDHPGLDDFLD